MGKCWTEERKEKWRGKSNPMYGKTGENHPTYGKHWSWTEEQKRRVRGKNSYNYGKHPLKTTIEKLREASSGKNNPMYGVPSPNTGKHFSEKHRKKIGDGNRGKKRSLETREKIRNSNYHKNLKGENSPAWLDGKSFEPYTLDFNRKFKESIKERDFHCCQLCNIGEEDLLLLKRYLVIHHIDYNKLLSIPQNGITLCDKCNGIVNFNRKQWIVFFQSILKERHNYQYTQDQKIILDYIQLN